MFHSLFPEPGDFEAFLDAFVALFLVGIVGHLLGLL